MQTRHLSPQPDPWKISIKLLLSVSFFSEVLLYSVELGKNAHKGPSQPCGFIKLSIKKTKNRTRKRACQGEKLSACSFPLQSLTTRSIKSIRWQSRFTLIRIKPPKLTSYNVCSPHGTKTSSVWLYQRLWSRICRQEVRNANLNVIWKDTSISFRDIIQSRASHFLIEIAQESPLLCPISEDAVDFLWQ